MLNHLLKHASSEYRGIFPEIMEVQKGGQMGSRLQISFHKICRYHVILKLNLVVFKMLQISFLEFV